MCALVVLRCVGLAYVRHVAQERAHAFFLTFLQLCIDELEYGRVGGVPLLFRIHSYTQHAGNGDPFLIAQDFLPVAAHDTAQLACVNTKGVGELGITSSEVLTRCCHRLDDARLHFITY